MAIWDHHVKVSTARVIKFFSSESSWTPKTQPRVFGVQLGLRQTKSLFKPQCFFVLSSIWAPSEHYIWALFEFLSKTEHPNLSTFWEIHWSEHVDLSTFFKLGVIWAPWSEHFCKNCSYLSSLIWALFWNLFKSERCCFSPENQKCPWKPLSALLSSFLTGQKKYHANFLHFFHGQYHFFLWAILWNFLEWACVCFCGAENGFSR